MRHVVANEGETYRRGFVIENKTFVHLDHLLGADKSLFLLVLVHIFPDTLAHRYEKLIKFMSLSLSINFLSSFHINQPRLFPNPLSLVPS